MNLRPLGSILILAFILSYGYSCWGADNALEAAQREYAMHFFSVDAHVNLAKQQYDHGDRLQAFYTLETARRSHFEQEVFTRAFHRIFLNDIFDNSPQAEAALKKKITASPSDFDTLTQLADIYISREDYSKAIPLLQKASELHPDDFSTVAALGQVYERMGQAQKSTSVVAAWTKAHPESLDTYRVRINEFFKQKKFADARPLIDEALKKYTDDAILHQDLGIVLERTGDQAAADGEFEKAAQLGPKLAQIQGWLARSYWLRKVNLRRALDLYLNAYFLDPEFYDTEYAEERIQKIAPMVAEPLLQKASGNLHVAELLPLKPAVELVMLRTAEEHWTPASGESLLEIMGSEDEGNRATAMTLLAEHKDAHLEEQVFQLLQDPDLRKRGMAGYLAVKWQKEKALPVMQRWLNDPAELVRFDAISALMDGGPEGRKIVEQYSRSGKERSPQIRSMMSSAMKEKAEVDRH